MSGLKMRGRRMHNHHGAADGLEGAGMGLVVFK